MHKLVSPWNAVFDMPHTREQAIAVIGKWGDGAMTYSNARAKRCYELLTEDKPKQYPVQILMVVTFDRGWEYVTKEGHFGYFETWQQAQNEALKAEKQ
jgi:hypothetical protein